MDYECSSNCIKVILSLFFFLRSTSFMTSFMTSSFLFPILVSTTQSRPFPFPSFSQLISSLFRIQYILTTIFFFQIPISLQTLGFRYKVKCYGKSDCEAIARYDIRSPFDPGYDLGYDCSSLQNSLQETGI